MAATSRYAVVAASLRRGLHSAHRPSSSKTRVIALDFRCTSLGQIVHSRWRSSGGKPRGQVVTKQGADSSAVPPSWVKVTVAPNLAPLTHATCESHVRTTSSPKSVRCGLIGFASPTSKPGSIASPHNASAAHRERRAWVMVVQFLTLIPVALALRVAAAHAISATGHDGGRRRHARSTRCVISGGRLDRRGGTALSIRFGRATCLRRTPASSSAVSAGLARRAWPLVLTRRVFNKLHRTSPRGREPSVDAGRCSGAQRRSQRR